MDGFQGRSRFGLRAMRGARIVAIGKFPKESYACSGEGVTKVSSQMRVRVVCCVQFKEVSWDDVQNVGASAKQ